jgi:hypothetical protein
MNVCEKKEIEKEQKKSIYLFLSDLSDENTQIIIGWENRGMTAEPKFKELMETHFEYKQVLFVILCLFYPKRLCALKYKTNIIYCTLFILYFIFLLFFYFIFILIL